MTDLQERIKEIELKKAKAFSNFLYIATNNYPIETIREASQKHWDLCTHYRLLILQDMENKKMYRSQMRNYLR